MMRPISIPQAVRDIDRLGDVALVAWVQEHILKNKRRMENRLELALYATARFHHAISNTPGALHLNHVQISGLGYGNVDGAEWAASFDSLSYEVEALEWYEIRVILTGKYPTTSRARHFEDALLRAVAKAWALLQEVSGNGQEVDKS